MNIFDKLVSIKPKKEIANKKVFNSIGTIILNSRNQKEFIARQDAKPINPSLPLEIREVVKTGDTRFFCLTSEIGQYLEVETDNMEQESWDRAYQFLLCVHDLHSKDECDKILEFFDAAVAKKTSKMFNREPQQIIMKFVCSEGGKIEIVSGTIIPHPTPLISYRIIQEDGKLFLQAGQQKLIANPNYEQEMKEHEEYQSYMKQTDNAYKWLVRAVACN